MPRALIPGFAFKEGRLWIFSEAQVLRIGCWPELPARRRAAPQGDWTPFVPPFRLLRPSAAAVGASLGPAGVSGRTIHAELERETAFRGFRFALPPEVARVCEVFPARHWRLLRLCAEGTEAVELLQAHPVLGFCVAHWRDFIAPGTPVPSSLGRVPLLRQRDIARWLGFPSGESAVKLLRKLPVATLHLGRLKALQQAVRRPGARELLAHVPHLNAGVLELMTDAALAGLVTPKLLAEVSADSAEESQPQAAVRLRAVTDLWQRLERPGVMRPFASLARLQAAQEELTAELQRRAALGLLGEPLPPPPLPGNRDIEPLTTEAMLIEEGRAQHNCAGSLARRVRKGDCYLYRVLRPERATLAIERGDNGDWGIAQIKLACNEFPAARTCEAVETWLRMYALSV